MGRWALLRLLCLVNSGCTLESSWKGRGAPLLNTELGNSEITSCSDPVPSVFVQLLPQGLPIFPPGKWLVEAGQGRGNNTFINNDNGHIY